MKLKGNYKTPIKILLGLILLGSIIGIENSQAFGCMNGLEMISIGNLIFFLISSFLLYKAIKTSDPKLVFILVLIETIIWILKYVFYKGGYITGFGGTPNPLNVVYDFTAIIIRIWLLLRLSNKIKHTILLSISTALILVILKINIFATPVYSKIMWKLEDKRTDKQRTEIVGKYNGKIIELSTNEEAQIIIEIDSSKLLFVNKQVFNLKKEYYFNLDYLDTGVISNNTHQEYEFKIEKLDKDSLIFILEDNFEQKFTIKLKTER